MFYLIGIHYMVRIGRLKKCIILYCRPNYRQCLQSARYKICNLTSFIRLQCKIKNINNIFFKFTMLTDNNQIFRNCFVIIYCHLTKVSPCGMCNDDLFIIIIYHDFLPTPRRGSHIKSDKTHTQSSRYTPEPIYLTPEH